MTRGEEERFDVTDAPASDSDELLRELARTPEVKPPSGPPVTEGTRVGHFRIVGKIGQGGMGVVFKALDERLKRTVALKLLPPLSVEEPESRARFFREARSLAAVTHANIATVYEVDEADHRIFIAMEYVEGRSLHELLREGEGRDPPVPGVPHARSLAIATDVARALAAAHEAGIVHRDLKPENVMVATRGTVKLVDFGIAKALDHAVDGGDVSVATGARGGPPPSSQGDRATHVTRMGRIVGTPEYMSPEQARGEPVDTRSDVFSFGVMLHEMLTRTRPFHRDSNAETLEAIAEHEPPAASEVNAAVSPELAAIVARCLSKEPADRFAHAGEVVTALASIASPGLGPPAAPPPNPSAAARRSGPPIRSRARGSAGRGVGDRTGDPYALQPGARAPRGRGLRRRAPRPGADGGDRSSKLQDRAPGRGGRLSGGTPGLPRRQLDIRARSIRAGHRGRLGDGCSARPARRDRPGLLPERPSAPPWGLPGGVAAPSRALRP